jgi:hypothetical protein
MQKSLFSLLETSPSRYYIFKGHTELGRLYDCIPWDSLTSAFGKKERKSKAGAPAWFDERGMVALLLAKHYLNVSDEQLIERLNTDLALQYFQFSGKA